AGDVFTAKYDPEGNVLWAASAGGTGTDNGTGIGVDAAGNCYITGHFSSTSITFGATTLTRTGSENVFVVKYDASGNVLWANRAGGTGFDAGSGIAVDAAGNSY